MLLISFAPRKMKSLTSKIIQIIKPTTRETNTDEEMKSITETSDDEDVEEKKENVEIMRMKAEIDMAGTFYNSCPSICLQILIVITFPNRVMSWFQIGSVSVSSFMTLWTAVNLYQLELRVADDKPEKLTDKVKRQS